MPKKIANAALLMTMLKDSGYKNLSYAIAELVDNSIEANAKNIGIYLKEKNVTVSRTVQHVDEVAVFDDGIGMDDEILGSCLALGWGTRLDNATSLGKYGFGLKGASIAFANRLEVYSWRVNDKVRLSYLDYDEVCREDSEELPELQEVDLPSSYGKIIRDTYNGLPESGTLVVWKNLDSSKFTPKQSTALISQINSRLCRIFRHFLDDDDEVGVHRNITVQVIGTKNQVTKPLKLRSNDPLYLNVPSNTPGYEKEATNEKNDEVNIKVIDPDGIERNVHILSSVAKPEIQAIGGNSEIGRHYNANNGISFVRSHRELENEIKGFFNNSEPRNRWHGIEIRFGPELDDYFGVPNNKQSITQFRNFSTEEVLSLTRDIEELPDGTQKNSQRMKLDLHRIVSRMVKSNEAVVKSRGSTRTATPGQDAETTIAGKVSKKLRTLEPDATPISLEQAKNKSYDEKLQELIEVKMNSDTSLNYGDAAKIAEVELSNMLHIEEAEWPGSTFLDVSYKANAAVALINRRHPFFAEFYDILRESDDQKGFEALKILMMAFVRTEDMLSESLGPAQFERIRDKWGSYMKDLADLSS